MKLLQPNKLILIGASTGGPSDIKKILKSIPHNFYSPIIIAQHMGNEFISSFALHMNANTHLDVKVPNNNEVLKSKTVYIVSKNCRVLRQANNLLFQITINKKNIFNPNINELFTSCAHFSNYVAILACILTGIGDDGSKGIASLCKTDATCVAANKSSSVVHGMPQRASEVSKDVQVLSIDDIINTIHQFGEE
ncbi:MAG: chemotaxis protein CheB [Sulfurimonas sp.]|nr:chemotaxis protein CheB [Sulfurimonas sp.]